MLKNPFDRVFELEYVNKDLKWIYKLKGNFILVKLFFNIFGIICQGKKHREYYRRIVLLYFLVLMGIKILNSI